VNLDHGRRAKAFKSDLLLQPGQHVVASSFTLGLYPYIEDIHWDTGRQGFGISTGGTARSMRNLVASGFHV
jgi:hypothetical protein